MKLQIRKVSCGGIQLLCLCDENGVALPCQTASEYKGAVGGLPTFTVTFVCAQDEIEIVDGEPVT